MKRLKEKGATDNPAEVKDRKVKVTERFPRATDKVFETTERKRGDGWTRRSDG